MLRISPLIMRSILASCKCLKEPQQVTYKISRMLTFESSLGTLPIPPLQASLNKFLRTVKPLISENDFVETTKVVQEFGKQGGVGEKLQSLLEERGRTSENWLSDWWLHAAYLDYRLPVVVHSNPGMVFPLQDYRGQEGQLRFAAKLITSALNYKIKIDEGTLPPDKLQGKPLCMDQYYKIFSACRIGGVTRDEFVCYPPNLPNPPRHIIIAHNNYFFSLCVFDKNHTPLNEEQVLEQLLKIINQSQFPGDPIGILTTENRNTWGKIYKKLCKDKTNLASLQEIQKSIFMVCLDQPAEINGPNLMSQIGLQMLHGGGSNANSGNRWFDKTIQFVVGTDGICGMNYEHSAAEGPPIASLMDFILDQCKSDKSDNIPSSSVLEPRRLPFNISEAIVDEIETAKRNLDTLVQDVELNCFSYEDFGKSFIKLQKLSPDSTIQMAMQLAYFRIYGHSPASYETASLRTFKLGRTETIRSASIESLRFCKAMLDSSESSSAKLESLKNAVSSHKKYTSEAMQGAGIDRHLLGLKLLAIENGMNVPTLFMDTAYTSSIHFKISSSQVPAKYSSFLCFGPVVPDGYGVCYNPQEHRINFSVSAFNSSPETSVNNYKTALEQSFREIRDILMTSQQSKL